MMEWMAGALQGCLDFSNVLNISITAGWLVLAVLFLRLLLRKSPKWLHAALWGLVAVRLLLPFSIQSVFSLIPSTETVPREILGYEGSRLQEPARLDILSNPVYAGDFSVELGRTVDRVQVGMIQMTVVWLLGAAVLLLYGAVSCWLLHRRVSTAVRLQDNIFQSERVSSPFVLGVIRPRIYLPFQIDNRNLEYVVAHEQAHIRRRDHWWKPLGFLLLAVYWFNPLLWLAYVLMCRDIELACDEKVIGKLNTAQRADYSQALLACSISRRTIAACPLAFGEVGVKERVKSVLSYKKPAFLAVAAGVLACAVAAVCFLTDPQGPAYDFTDNPISEAATQDTRFNGGVGEPLVRTLSSAQIQELESRLENLSGTRRDSAPTGSTPLYSLSLRLKDGTAWSFCGYASDEDQVYTQYEGKNYRITDGEFCKYLSRVCAGADVVNAQEAPDLPVILDESNAAEFISQVLSTLTLHSDHTVSFSLPEEVPVSQDGKTCLTISLNAAFSPEPGSYSVQELLDWETEWQGGEQYSGALDTARGDLDSVMLRVAFMTREGDDLYREYAANYVEVSGPFTYDVPVGFAAPAVQVAEEGAKTKLLYTLKSGKQAGISLTIPDGLALAQGEQSYDAPVLLLTRSGQNVGEIILCAFGTADERTLELVQTWEDSLPMEIFSPIALSNHSGYDSYRVRKYGDTGACATAQYLWQDLMEGESGAEAPVQKADCVLAYDWEVMPYFLEITVQDGLLSEEELAGLAESIGISAVQ